MRETSPQIHSSIITSPTTTTRRPPCARAARPRAAPRSAQPRAVTRPVDELRGRCAARRSTRPRAASRRAQIGLGPVVRLRPGHENAGDADRVPERDVAAAVADHRAAVEREPVLVAPRGAPARAPACGTRSLVVVRAPVPARRSRRRRSRAAARSRRSPRAPRRRRSTRARRRTGSTRPPSRSRARAAAAARRRPSARSRRRRIVQETPCRR